MLSGAVTWRSVSEARCKTCATTGQENDSVARSLTGKGPRHARRALCELRALSGGAASARNPSEAKKRAPELPCGKTSKVLCSARFRKAVVLHNDVRFSRSKRGGGL